MNIIEKLKKIFTHKDEVLYKKIDELERSIEDVRELTTENYWKLKKDMNKKAPPKKRVKKTT